ncbi:MAG: HD domain-containing protein [Pelosinus sp.]|nr:HD domain-containing protein [Pelosinus sp.]
MNTTYKEIYIAELKQYFGVDQRRINHALKVLKAAEAIMAGEDIIDARSRIITIAAILHDIGIKNAEAKYHSSAGTYQELEGPPVAREIMLRRSESTEVVERVTYIVGGHHTPSKNDGLDFQVIWEADWFVNIEEDGLFHDKNKVQQIIAKNFATMTGKQMAQNQYL